MPKEKIYSFIHPLNDQYSYDAAVWNKSNNENMSFRKIEYIISNKDYFENRGIFILYDRDHKRYENLGGKDTKYVVVGYSKLAESDEIVNNLKKFHKIELVKSFYPTKNEKYLKNGIDYDILNNPADWRSLFYLEKSGGFLDIYKVDYGQ